MVVLDFAVWNCTKRVSVGWASLPIVPYTHALRVGSELASYFAPLNPLWKYYPTCGAGSFATILNVKPYVLTTI